ncbi:MAG: hypothetical protein R3C18_00150 [Planctomycetaceae bacterium]
MTLGITICATKNYTYAMGDQARRVIANLRGVAPGHIILSGDDSPELARIVDLYKRIVPEGWGIHLIKNQGLNDDHGQHYKRSAQLLIAALRSEAFSCARKLNCDMCWSLDSDVLPPANALRCMRTMLDFDDGYYSISTCPYPNQLFLGGRGTPQNPICEDFLPSERKLPDELKERWEKHEKEFAEAKGEAQAALMEERKKLQEEIRKHPPDGTIWQVIAKHGWRRRGWLDHAYPAIGKGAVLPSDWCGFGCTLLNRQALDLAYFDGYDGKGTEDMFIVWKRWHPAGLRLNVITHCPCDHVIWEKKKGGEEGKYTLLETYHEGDGEYAGHLRIRPKQVSSNGGFLSPVAEETATNDEEKQS